MSKEITHGHTKNYQFKKRKGGRALKTTRIRKKDRYVTKINDKKRTLRTTTNVNNYRGEIDPILQEDNPFRIRLDRNRKK